MNNVHSDSSCLLCHAAKRTDTKADADMVNCARGHAFHRDCLIQQDCFRRCPQNNCDAHIPCFVKPLADRLAQAVLPYIGLAQLFDTVVMADVQQSGVSLENARQSLSESEFLMDYLRHTLPGSLRSATYSVAAIAVTAIATHYLLPSQPDFSGSQDNSAGTPMEEALLTVD
ncbi:hypothetical protein [Salinisphaera sp. G21_0]|uniref:hypothetical protein n=1 Tax=Salinisphaera sp. G21_0 TaxID=2821094 RepID=UPI001ADB415C|nr:hypothetical protein [Salinisphaera sp. G21_0]MBO9482513.1 hypothetical protein [Salinisphaera sp. G21_0]